MAIALLAAPLATPAFAGPPAPSPPGQPPKSQQEIENDRAAERAYKNSLRNIPDKPPADPWGIVRGDDTPKPAGKPAAAKQRSKTGDAAN